MIVLNEDAFTLAGRSHQKLTIKERAKGEPLSESGGTAWVGIGGCPTLPEIDQPHLPSTKRHIYGCARTKDLAGTKCILRANLIRRRLNGAGHAHIFQMYAWHHQPSVKGEIPGPVRVTVSTLCHIAAFAPVWKTVSRHGVLFIWRQGQDIGRDFFFSH